MYLEFYGLSEKPFSQTPDPRFLYWNDAYRETLASLSYGIRERKGFIAMLGEAGTGKTTLLRKLLEDLGDDVVSVFLFNPNATFEEILEYTLSELGIPTPSGRKLAMLQRLNEFLLAAYSEGRNTILLIDEAQDLDSDVLESLRLLSNLETSDDKILQIVLSGQPELAEKLADPGLRQLKQRIAVRCRLEPLREDELPSYVRARLEIAGASPELFDPQTYDAIWDFSSGIPRMVNTVCDNALLLGYALGKRTIDAEVLTEVIADLRKLDVEEWLPTRPGAQNSPDPQPSPELPAPPREAATTARGPVAPDGASPYEPRGPEGEPFYYEPLPSRGLVLPNWLVAAGLVGLGALLSATWFGGEGTATPSPVAPVESAIGGGDIASTSVAIAATSRPDFSKRPVREQATPPAADGTEPSTRRTLDAAVAKDTSANATTGEGIAVAGAGAPPAAARGPAVAPPERAPSAPQPPAVVAGARPFAAEPKADPRSSGEKEGRPLQSPSRIATGSVPPQIDRNRIAAAPSIALDRAPAAPAIDRTRIPAPPGTSSERIATAESAAIGPMGTQPVEGLVAVKPGDTLIEIAYRHYGSTNLTTLDMLKTVNPEIRNVDLIIAGQGLVLPEPGSAARVLPDETGFSILALTTQTLSRALALQSSLEDRFDRAVTLERIATREGDSMFRVSVRSVSERDDAVLIASSLGPIGKDPRP